MSKIGVGVIGASPLRPGWAVTAHLPALLALSEYELRAVATSSEASAKAAGEAYGVPAYADPAAMIARADIDLVVVTVKLAHHHTLRRGSHCRVQPLGHLSVSFESAVYRLVAEPANPNCDTDCDRPPNVPRSLTGIRPARRPKPPEHNRPTPAFQYRTQRGIPVPLKPLILRRPTARSTTS